MFTEIKLLLLLDYTDSTSTDPATINNSDQKKTSRSQERICGDNYAHSLLRENFKSDEDGNVLTPSGDRLSVELQNLFEMMADHYSSVNNT